MQEATKPNILVVDDTPANLLTMKKLLKGFPVNVYTADSGNQALTMLLSNSFHLILMDVIMPIMGGYEAAELIVEHEEFKQIPIIFVSAMDERVKYKMKNSNSFVDYLYKPIDPELLFSKIKTLTNLEIISAVQQK